MAPAPGTLSISKPAAVAVEDMFDERKPEPGAALGAALGHIHPIEALGQSRQMFRCDAGPVIAYPDQRLGLALG